MKLKFNGFLVLLVVLVAQLTFAQERSVSGIVSDNAGMPLPGVSVLVKGTKTGTQSDFDGKYSIKAQPSDVLVFSYVGMKSTEKSASSTTVNAKLASDAMELESVVVTALGIKKSSKALAYATQTVKGDEVLKSGRSNVMDGLSGKVSGVQITNSGGQAGGGTNVVIRGYSSITGNNQPLYVVDGVPIDNSTENTGSTFSGTPSANRASDISPEDVANVTILKGGAATALYGIRAANGAIIITTKKGKVGGGFNIDLSTNYSTETANKYPSLSDKFTTGSNGIWNSGTTNQWGPLADSGATYPAGTERDLDGNGTIEDISGQKIVVYPNNYKNFFQNGNTVKYNIAVSGGGEKNSFYTSISHLDQEGIIPNNTFKRTSALFSASEKFTDKFDMDAKVNYINSSGKFFNNSQISQTLGYFNNTYDVVNFPYQDQYGNRTYWHGSISDPMWTVNKTGENRNLDRFISNIGFNYKITSKLTISYKIGLDTYSEQRRNYNPIGTAEFQDTNYLGDLREMRINSRDINSDLFLRYDTNLGDDFKISAMVGQNFFQKKYDQLTNTGTSFIIPDLIDIQNTVEKKINHYSYSKELIGYFGEITTSYKNLLYLTLTGRQDKASTLPVANNTFFYPSASLGFIFSELLNKDSFYGKLRGSYAGIANIPDAGQLQTIYKKQDVNYFGLPAYSLDDTNANRNLKPENIKQWEVGLELSFLRNKIGFEANYYNKHSYDQIIYAPVSNITGFTTQIMNIGEIENHGIEATLRFTDLIKTEGLTWTTEFNFTKNEGNIIKVGENGLDQVQLSSDTSWSNGAVIAKAGMPFGAIYGYTYEHSIPGDQNSPLLVNAAGTPSLSAEKVVLGNTLPDFILGWNTAASYKGINAGFTLERKQGGDVINDFASQNSYSGHGTNTENRYYTTGTDVKGTQNFHGVDASGKPVDVATPLNKAFYTTLYRSNTQNFVEDASWWRLRNVYLGYTVSKNILKKTGLAGLEFTFSARNLWLKTNYSGIDPELNSSGTAATTGSTAGNGSIGIDSNSIPNTKSFDFGVKVKL
jgi:TonB-linked SusC/RagA family outer membrane protein